MAEGHGTDRRDVMCNDFVIAGPKPDPAGIQGLKSASAALARIAAAQVTFVSRGDDSGTNRLERRLWRSVDLRPDQSSAWYRQVGQRMGATLNIAAGLDAYTLTDRATGPTSRNVGTSKYSLNTTQLCTTLTAASRSTRPGGPARTKP